jgi:hypothetical protein
MVISYLQYCLHYFLLYFCGNEYNFKYIIFIILSIIYERLYITIYRDHNLLAI